MASETPKGLTVANPMIKTVFKAHPIMIVQLMKPYAFVLILPLIRALIQYVTKGETDGLLVLELVAFGFVLTMAIFGWRSISITVNNQCIMVKSGFLIKSCANIDLSRLSSICLKQGVFDFVFGSVDCAVNTEAGTPRKSDFNLKMHKSEAKRLYNVIYGQEKQTIIKFSAYRIALLAAATSSAVSGIIVGLPIINKVGDLVGIAITDMLIGEINNVSIRFNSIFPPIVNTVTIVLLFAYMLSFVISFLKHVNFKLKSTKRNIEVTSGVITRKAISFKKSKVNNICFEQTPLMRLLKKYSMRASIGGYGDAKGEKAIVVPVATHNELEERLKEQFPFLQPEGERIKPIQTTRNLNRFLYIPIIIAFLMICTGAVCVLIFPYFDKLVLFLTFVLLGADAYYASICYHNYKQGMLCLGNYLLASGSAGFTVRELYCEKSKIGVIKIIQTPADRRLKTCKVKLTVRSENADSVSIRNIDLRTATNSIYNTFELNVDE